MPTRPSGQSFSDSAVIAFRDRARKWLAASVPQKSLASASHDASALLRIRREWDKTLFDGGFAGLAWPREYGGRGLGPIEEAVFFEEAAAAHAPEEFGAIGKYVAGPAIFANGTEEQKRLFLPRILNGSQIWCEGFSEPGAGSDLAAVTTTATRRPDGTYAVTGQKIWTSFAAEADRCYLLARTSLSAPRHRNLTVFLLDMHGPGIHVVPMRQINGQSDFNEVFFDGAICRPDEVLGQEGAGWSLTSLSGFRSRRQLLTGLRAYLQMRPLVDQLCECCDEVGHQSEAAADIDLRVEVLLWHVRRATELMANDLEWQPSVAVVKSYWSRLLQELTLLGVSVGCPRHSDLWRARYLDCRGATIYGGTEQIQKNVIADRILALPR
jgi:alkylation response protein AidB-like acyl-CoA dehydrogenase